MYRIAANRLVKWKDSPRRKPLILRGARQVGKTWLIENILAEEFEDTVTIDLEARRDLHSYFEGNLDPMEILKGLELATKRIIPGRTLLFLDEIQACPRAITALRYFYEKLPELHVIAAGSLLEFAFGEISVPVGRLQFINIYPMTFYEYLLAIGKDSMAHSVISDPSGLSEEGTKTILNELKNFFFIGGMPEAVRTYKDTHSLVEVFEVHNEILESFRSDFSKYTPKVDPVCLDEVFLHAAKSSGEQLKYSRMSSNFSYHTNHKAFNLLVKARVLQKVSSCDPSGLPLAASAHSKVFKSFLLDIGLLQKLCQVPVDIEITEDNLLALYRGKLAEQFAAQELSAWQDSDLFFWSRHAKNSSAEVDFILSVDGQIYPVEVKAGPSGKLRSMHLLLNTYSNCRKGYVLHSGPYSDLQSQKLRFLPLYSAGWIAGAERWVSTGEG